MCVYICCLLCIRAFSISHFISFNADEKKQRKEMQSSIASSSEEDLEKEPKDVTHFDQSLQVPI